MSDSQPMIVVAALYKFVSLPDCREIREPLLDHCMQHGVKGTLLLAEEGINGTIAGTREGIDAALAYLRNDARLTDLDHKESYTDEMPFYRMKVKLKKEIVTLGVSGIDPNARVGTYVKPEDWNALISDPDVVLVDTRNDYEFDIGTFKKAINPDIQNFRDFPAYVQQNLSPEKHKKVAMFCTGGIRCEKATAYMLQQGYEEVYHLQGGILKYIEQVPEEQSLWQGECFVFDNRVAVNHKLEKGKYDQCHGCRYPITVEDKQSEKYIEGVCCPHCHDTQSAQTRRRAAERQKQIELAKLRNEKHIGVDPRLHVAADQP